MLLEKTEFIRKIWETLFLLVTKDQSKSNWLKNIENFAKNFKKISKNFQKFISARKTYYSRVAYISLMHSPFQDLLNVFLIISSTYLIALKIDQDIMLSWQLAFLPLLICFVLLCLRFLLLIVSSWNFLGIFV